MQVVAFFSEEDQSVQSFANEGEQHEKKRYLKFQVKTSNLSWDIGRDQLLASFKF